MGGERKRWEVGGCSLKALCGAKYKLLQIKEVTKAKFLDMIVFVTANK